MDSVNTTKYPYEGIFCNPQDISQIVRATNVQDMIQALEQEIKKLEEFSTTGLDHSYETDVAKSDLTALKENYDAIINSHNNIQQEIDSRISTFVTFGTTEENISSWNRTQDPHITTSFSGGHLPAECFGKQATITMDGYGYDSKKGLFALHVAEVAGSDKNINEAIEKTAEQTPLHITIANGHDTKPAQSRELFENGKEYSRFERPFTIRGTYGGFIQEHQIDILSPEEKQFQEHAEKKLSGRNDAFANAFRAANAKTPGDAKLYLLQTMEQRIAGETNVGSDFGQTTPEELFNKIADITHGAVLRGQKEILQHGLTQPGDDMMHHYARKALMQVNTQLSHLEADYRNKYGTQLPELKDTTERDVANGDTRETNATYEFQMPGHSGVMDIDRLPNTAVIYLDKTHGDNLSVCAAGIDKEPTNIAHLVFAKGNNGDPSFFLTTFPGPMKPPFELSNNAEIHDAGEQTSHTQTAPMRQYDVLSKKEAKELGVAFVKYSPELPEPARENLNQKSEQGLHHKLEELKQRYDTHADTMPLGEILELGKQISSLTEQIERDTTGKDTIALHDERA